MGGSVVGSPRVKPGRPMSVTQFEREATRGRHSIERLFRQIRAALSDRVDVRVVRCPIARTSLGWFVRGCWRAWWNRSEVNHICGDVHYLALVLPGRRTVLTIHDLGRLNELRGWRGWFYDLLYFRLPLKSARWITCISDETRRQLVERYPWVESRVKVIPNCVPDSYSQVPTEFNTDPTIVLQIGTAPHKNLERVAQGVAAERCFFRVIGRMTGGQRKLLRDLGLPHEELVDLSDQELRQAYIGSDIVTFVSTREGFGLPIIEANAIGRAVITSNRSPMKEVAGGAACLVDPLDVQSIRAAIRLVVSDVSFRQGLVRKGLENSARF